jgi:hypothetical protein
MPALVFFVYTQYRLGETKLQHHYSNPIINCTDGIYGIFSEEDVKNRITSLNKYSQKTTLSEEEINKIAFKVAEELKNNKI